MDNSNRQNFDNDSNERSNQSQYDQRRSLNSRPSREDSSRDSRSSNRHKMSQDYDYSNERSPYDNSDNTDLRRYNDTHPEGYQDNFSTSQHSRRSSVGNRSSNRQMSGLDYGFDANSRSESDYRNDSQENRSYPDQTGQNRYGSPERFSNSRNDRSERADQAHLGKGPKGYTRSNEKIEDEVCNELMRSPQIDASEIEVSVKDGIVTLSGTIDSKHTKRLAEDLCEDVLGVEDVQNSLRISKNSGSSDLKTSHSSNKNSSNSDSKNKH